MNNLRKEARRRRTGVLLASLLASMWVPSEAQGLQQGAPDVTVSTTLAAVEPHMADVRQAVILARVSTAPHLEFPDEAGLLDVRWVTGTADGFAVVDRLASMIGFFDHTGAWLGHVGSPGEGPGEFSGGLFHAAAVDDRLWVPDLRQRRLNLIDASTRTWLHSYPLNLLEGAPWAWLSPGEGELAAVMMSWGSPREPRTVSLSRWTGNALEPAFSWLEDDGRTGWAARTIVVEGPGERTVALLDRQAGIIQVHGFDGALLSRYAFDDDAIIHLTEDDRAYLARLREPRLAAWAQRAERNIARRLGALAAEAPEDVRRQLGNAAAEGPSSQRSHFSDRYPFFIDARFDAESETMWLARPLTAEKIRELPVQLDWEVLANSARFWDSYTLDGSFRYRLEVPPGFVLTDARDDRFYGYQVDELGLRHVVVLSVP